MALLYLPFITFLEGRDQVIYLRIITTHDYPFSSYITQYFNCFFFWGGGLIVICGIKQIVSCIAPIQPNQILLTIKYLNFCYQKSLHRYPHFSQLWGWFCSGPARTHSPALPCGCRSKFLACIPSHCMQGIGRLELRCGCGPSFCSSCACHTPMYYVCIKYLYCQLQLLRSGHAMAMGAFVQPRTRERWGTGPCLKIMTIQGTCSMVWGHQRPH